MLVPIERFDMILSDEVIFPIKNIHVINPKSFRISTQCIQESLKKLESYTDLYISEFYDKSFKITEVVKLNLKNISTELVHLSSKIEELQKHSTLSLSQLSIEANDRAGLEIQAKYDSFRRLKMIDIINSKQKILKMCEKINNFMGSIINRHEKYMYSKESLSQVEGLFTIQEENEKSSSFIDFDEFNDKIIDEFDKKMSLEIETEVEQEKEIDLRHSNAYSAIPYSPTLSQAPYCLREKSKIDLGYSNKELASFFATCASKPISGTLWHEDVKKTNKILVGDLSNEIKHFVALGKCVYDKLTILHKNSNGFDYVIAKQALQEFEAEMNRFLNSQLIPDQLKLQLREIEASYFEINVKLGFTLSNMGKRYLRALDVLTPEESKEILEKLSNISRQLKLIFDEYNFRLLRDAIKAIESSQVSVLVEILKNPFVMTWEDDIIRPYHISEQYELHAKTLQPSSKPEFHFNLDSLTKVLRVLFYNNMLRHMDLPKNLNYLEMFSPHKQYLQAFNKWKHQYNDTIINAFSIIPKDVLGIVCEYASLLTSSNLIEFSPQFSEDFLKICLEVEKEEEEIWKKEQIEFEVEQQMEQEGELHFEDVD